MKKVFIFFIGMILATTAFSQEHFIRFSLESENNYEEFEYREYTLNVSKEIYFSEEDLKNVENGYDDEYDFSYLSLEFNEEAAKRFADFTETNLSKNLVIIIDNKVIVSAVIRDKITGGKVLLSCDGYTQKTIVEKFSEYKQAKDSE